MFIFFSNFINLSHKNILRGRLCHKKKVELGDAVWEVDTYNMSSN